MFELANRLVGIYKTHDTTKSVTINPHCFEDAVTGRTSSAVATSSACASSTLAEEREEASQETNSSSPVTKKGRQNKGEKMRVGKGEEENEHLLSQKMSRESDQHKRVLGDSTNTYH
jgi:hypothetical protein